MSSLAVDAHLHVWEMPSERYPWSPLRNMRPRQAAPVEQLLATMKQNEVDKAVIVQPSNYGYDHRYLLDCLTRCPGQFGAVALLDFRGADASLRLADLAAQGIRGVRLYLYHEHDISWVDDGSMDPLMERSAALGMVVTVFGRWDMLAHVRNLVGRHPSVTFVLDHMGQPDVSQPQSWASVLRFARLPNVCIKLSGLPTLSREDYPFSDLFPFVRRVYEDFGSRRIMWASDFPHILRQTGYAPCLKLVDATLPDIPRVDRARILGETAAGIWGLGG
jgi:predicted TIM-barrel fold metal-dependent hydrolase